MQVCFFAEDIDSKIIKIKDTASCGICGKEFTSVGSARRHVQFSHMESGAQGTPPCFVCSKTFKHLSILKDHLRKRHKVYHAEYVKVYEKQN